MTKQEDDDDRNTREQEEQAERLRAALEKAENAAALRKINAIQDWAGKPRTT